MKRILLTAILLPSLCFADNLFKNGGMDTSSGWKGDRKFVPLDDSRVILLKADKRKPTSFYQSVDTKDIKDLTVKYRYKSFNYKGRGMQIRGTRGDGGSTFNTFDVEADGKWHEKTWRFSEVRDHRQIKFSFILLEGEGEVFFDDISVDIKGAD